VSIPRWFYGVGIPGWGWLVLLWAGYQLKDRWTILLALGYGGATLLGWMVDPLAWLPLVAWMAGIAHMTVLKDQYAMQLQLAQPQAAIQTIQQARLAQQVGVRVDINRATQDEMVYRLNLSILLVNRILEFRRAGVMFTSMEELASQAGIPLAKLKIVEPILCFAYYEPITTSSERWTQVNALSAEQISREFKIDLELSHKLVAERDLHGSFTSLVQLRSRVGIPYDLLDRFF